MKRAKRSKSDFRMWLEEKYETRASRAIEDGVFTYMPIELLKEAFEAGKRAKGKGK
jgi:hypothetical protein